jgi:hypothetical protein
METKELFELHGDTVAESEPGNSTGQIIGFGQQSELTTGGRRDTREERLESHIYQVKYVDHACILVHTSKT